MAGKCASRVPGPRVIKPQYASPPIRRKYCQDFTMCLNRLNRLHYGFGKFIYFCFQQKKIACIIEIIEKKLCHFFLSCTLCLFFLCHFFLVPFFPVPFFPVPFFPVPFFPTLNLPVCSTLHCAELGHSLQPVPRCSNTRLQ